MPKIELNPTFDEFHGSLNKVTYRMAYGKTFASVKAKRTNIPASPAQIAHQRRFAAAAAYGKTVMADPVVRAMYQQGAKERNMPIFALIMADFMNPPSVKQVDLSAYHGQVSDLIKVNVADDFGVVNALISIMDDAEGTTIESGFATETASGSGQWVYTATAAVPAGTTVNIQVVVSDRPGGTAVDTLTKTV